MNLLEDDPGDARATLVLAHGAGAPMDSPFMGAIAAAIAGRGIRVVRFEFPYMARRREGGPRRPPDPMPVLLASWREAIAAAGGATPVLGGKSLGGRAASLIADGLGVPGLVCLGFPFHAAGKAAGARIAHLARLRTPTLVVQGTRDPLGSAEEVAGYALSPAIRLHWIADANHSLEPPRASGRTAAAAWAEAAAAIADFVLALG
jgi:hypothetical protein